MRDLLPHWVTVLNRGRSAPGSAASFVHWDGRSPRAYGVSGGQSSRQRLPDRVSMIFEEFFMSAPHPRFFRLSLSVVAALSVGSGCGPEDASPFGDLQEAGEEGPNSTAPSTSAEPAAPTPTVASTTMPTERRSPLATLDERESPNDFPVEVSPLSATVGTVIGITARGCDSGQEVEFADRETVRAGVSAPAKSVPFEMSGSTLTAHYTIAPDDSPGGAVVSVICSNGQGSAPIRVVPG